jgi:NTE family protein
MKGIQQEIPVGIVLQGGGALGAYEVGVIEYLLEKRQQGLIKIEIVSGVSIGAINATLLCGARTEEPLDTLNAVWNELTIHDFPFVPKEINKLFQLPFGNPAMYRPRKDYYNVLEWTSFADTNPLREMLRKHVAFDELKPGNTERTRLILTATNIETGDIDSFDSRKMQIEPDHVLASAALPPGFPATAARNEHGHSCTYVDGGLFNNTPLSPVIHALEENVGGKSQSVDLMIVVNLYPRKGQVPKNMSEVMDRYIEILFSNKTSSDIHRAEQTRKLIRFKQEMESKLKPEAKKELSALPGYQEAFEVLNGWSPVYEHLIEIENTEPEPGDAATDFSPEAILRRRRSGYRDAEIACRNCLHEE